MKYIIYIRKSTEDNKKQIQSIQDQLDYAKQKAENLGIEVIATFKDEKTGTKPHLREGFNKMIELINSKKNKEGYGIICWKMDRLARNPVDEGSIKYAFMSGKLKHILAGDREFKENDNQILMSVEFGAATQYSIDLSRNVKRGMTSKAEKGLYPGAAPVGYKNDKFGIKGDKKIIPDGENFIIMKKIWKMLLTGTYSISQLQRESDKMGLTNQNGKKISISTFFLIFNKPFYYGSFLWSGILIKGNHKPMITKKEFDDAQKIINSNSGKIKPFLKTENKDNTFVFNGLIKCGECGMSITKEQNKYKKLKNGTVKEYIYLRCTKKNKEHKCSQKYLLQNDFYNQLNSEIDKIYITKNILDFIKKQLKEEENSNKTYFKKEKTLIQKKINKNNEDIKNLSKKLISGIISDNNYKIIIKDYEDKKDLLKNQINEIDNKKNNLIKNIKNTFEFANNIKGFLKNSSKNKKREMLLGLGSNFFIKDKKLQFKPNLALLEIKNTNSLQKVYNESLEPTQSCLNNTKKAPEGAISFKWSPNSDSNRRPLGLEPSALATELLGVGTI